MLLYRLCHISFSGQHRKDLVDSTFAWHSVAIYKAITCLNFSPPNKHLEWTGKHQLSATPPQAPCLPLRGSVGPSRCAADSTAQDYHQAFYIRPLNTIADPALSPRAMPARHRLHSFEAVRAMEQALLPTIEANRKGNLKNGRTYLF